MKANEYISLSDWDKLSSEEQEGVLNYGSVIMDDDTFIPLTELKRMAQMGSFS